MSPSYSNASAPSTPRTIDASRIGLSVFDVGRRMLFRKIFDVPKPSRNRPGPAASCTTRASMATWTGCRVNGEMIQPIVSRSVSRAISAETTGGTCLHPVLAPPRVGLGEPDRVHPRLVHDACRGQHVLERLHRELHDADAERWYHAILAVFAAARGFSPSFAQPHDRVDLDVELRGNRTGLWCARGGASKNSSYTEFISAKCSRLLR